MSSVETMLGVQPAARDVEWIKGALSCAITLEHATIPPYLCALWSIKPRGHAFRQIFKGVVLEEMGHMGLAANMLAGLGGSPPIGDPGFVPSYPTPLPCGIVPQHKPDLIIPLQGFSIAAVTEVFLNIEYPEKGPVPIEEAVWVPPLTHSIGEFYNAIRGAFLALDPALTFQTDKQLTVTFGGNPNNLVFQVTSVTDAVRAIDQIREQGEGGAVKSRA